MTCLIIAMHRSGVHRVACTSAVTITGSKLKAEPSEIYILACKRDYRVDC